MKGKEEKLEHNIIMQCGNVLRKVSHIRKLQVSGSDKEIRTLLDEIETNLHTIQKYEIKVKKIGQRVNAELKELRDSDLLKFHNEARAKEKELEQHFKVCMDLEVRVKDYMNKHFEGKIDVLLDLELHMRKIQNLANDIINLEKQMEIQLKKIRELSKKLAHQL